MIKGICIGDISIDCRDTVKQQNFYANLLGWTKKTMYGCPAVVGENGLIILFQGCDFEYVPPVWPEEAGKQQKLNPGGLFVLSIDKNQQTELSFSNRKIALYPDTSDETAALLTKASLIIEKQIDLYLKSCKILFKNQFKEEWGRLA